MKFKIAELRDKQVLSIKDASVIGFVSDIEIDSTEGKLISIIVSGKSRSFSLLGRGEDITIPFEKIDVIGNDSILVSFDGYIPQQRKKRGIINNLFYGE